MISLRKTGVSAGATPTRSTPTRPVSDRYGSDAQKPNAAEMSGSSVPVASSYTSWLVINRTWSGTSDGKASTGRASAISARDDCTNRLFPIRLFHTLAMTSAGSPVCCWLLPSLYQTTSVAPMAASPGWPTGTESTGVVVVVDPSTKRRVRSPTPSSGPASPHAATTSATATAIRMRFTWQAWHGIPVNRLTSTAHETPTHAPSYHQPL